MTTPAQAALPLEEHAQYLVVCVEAGLHHSRLTGLVAAFLSYPGVREVWHAAGLTDVLGLDERQLSLLEARPERKVRRKRSA